MKRVALFIIIAMTSVLLAGCNMEDKISEKIAEEMIEKSSGGEVDVDIDGEDVTYTTEEGEVTVTNDDSTFVIEGEDGSSMQSGDNVEWPTDQAAAYLPKCSAGKVSYLMNSDESCIIMLDEVSQEDYDQYEQAIKDAGYTNNAVESTAEDMVLYSGASADGVTVTVYISPSEAVMQITADASTKLQ